MSDQPKTPDKQDKPSPFIDAGSDVEDVLFEDSSIEHDGPLIGAGGSVRRIAAVRSRIGKTVKDNPLAAWITAAGTIGLVILTAVLVAK